MNGVYNIGDVVMNNWTLTRLIGEGSFGRVFEAQREDYGRIYKAAVKIITIPQSQSEIKSVMGDGIDENSATTYFLGLVGELVDEFSIMSQLKGNTNVVSYEDHTVIQHDAKIGWDILIRMELLTPLLDYVQNKALSAMDITRLGIDMCMALELCQKYNIVHRDLKPENIFVSETGNFKLGDFGIARTVEKTTGGLSKKGTYTYMAPEVYRGDVYGSSVDLYSLGIVLYWMLNDKRTPFLPDAPALISHSDRERAIKERMNGVQMPNPKNADERLARIILKACAFNPMERYTSPTQMRDELEATMNGTETSGDIYPRGDFAPVESKIHNEQSQARQGSPDIDKTTNLYPGPAGFDAAGDRYGYGNTGEKTVSTHFRPPVIDSVPNAPYESHVPFAAKASGAYQPTPAQSPGTSNQKKIPLMAILMPAAMVIIAVVLIITLTNNGSNDSSSADGDASPRSDRISSEMADSEDTPRSVEMPDLLDQHFSQARNVLDSLGLDLVVIEETRESDDVEKGFIIRTIPEAGKPLARGNSVTIIYSEGPAITEVIVPDLVGSTREQVEAAFKTLGITPLFIEFSDESPVGTVLFIVRQGQTVTVPTTIEVHVSSGAPAPTPTPVPVPVPVPSTLSIRQQTFPPDQYVGALFAVRGIIESNYIIRSVTVAVYNDNGVAETGKTVAPNTYTYDIKNLDYDLLFDILSVGYKTYIVEATDELGTKTLVNYSFRVRYR